MNSSDIVSRRIVIQIMECERKEERGDESAEMNPRWMKSVVEESAKRSGVAALSTRTRVTDYTGKGVHIFQGCKTPRANPGNG